MNTDAGYVGMQGAYCCEVEIVEDATARLPHLGGPVLLLTLVYRMSIGPVLHNERLGRTVEAIDLRNLSALVVPSQQRDLVGVSATSSMRIQPSSERER